MSANKSGGSKGIDRKLISELASLLEKTGLSEIEIEEQGRRIKLVRHAATSVIPAGTPAPAAPAPAPLETKAAPAEAAPPAQEDKGTLVRSPIVGTAYLAPEPGASVFIKVGDTIEKGQSLLIVEAMKTMNHIPAPKSGKVLEVLVEDGQPVEFDEPLVRME